MIDRRLSRAALYLGILAVFTWFGVVHSASPDGSVYLPWTLPDPLQRAIPNQFGLGYLVLAVLMLVLARTKQRREAPPAELGHVDP
jgi:AGZA family xanthine/uracil permease-like MFS transporter